MKNNKKILKKAISLIIALIMVISAMPIMTFADDAEEYVYLSVSYDKNYINDKNGAPMVFVPVALADIAAVDLTEYGLDNMLFDADGDGEYETTALQLLIYAHEELWGGSWGEVNFDALPGSSYFKGGIFGFTENLVYFLNGDFPVDESMSSDWMTTGATSDRIVLEAGDFLDVASFECFSFLWDQLGGFHLFADEDGNYVHDYTAEAGEALTIKLKHSFCDLMYGASWVKEANDFEVFYGSLYGEAIGSVITDDEGNAEIIFPTAGTYYVWSEGGLGSDDGTHGACDHYASSGEPCVVSSPAYARVTVTGGEIAEPDQPRQPQSVSAVLNATMEKLATTVNAPTFGTNAGEWTVFSLARGGYFAKDNAYFSDYYNRIVATVNEIAADVNLNGALDKNKSTENSRLIVALSSIGKNATSVGDWDLVEAYSANGLNWIKKQGMNGTIWTLIALDSGNYETSDPTIRQQCIDDILASQHDDNGWSLVTAKAQPSNVDITCMTLTALYPYRDQPAVAEACEKAIEWLSESQLPTGGFPYGQGETSESCAWAIVALTMWGINPDTDQRFIKNGNSAIDNLLTYYLADEAMFEHGKGAGANAMATDQATYALVAYDRFINGKTALYDYSDVEFDALPEYDGFTAILGLPAKIETNKKFNATISVNEWDNESGYKLIDLIFYVPAGIGVTDLNASTRLKGGSVSYNLEESTGKLRVVYFDPNQNSDITVNGTSTPIELFTIGLMASDETADSSVQFAITGMSVKLSSDSTDSSSMVVVNTDSAKITSEVVEGITFSAVCLYEGDGVDLIPTGKKAVAISVTGIERAMFVVFDDGENYAILKYSGEMSEKTGVATYVALVNKDTPMLNFTEPENYELRETAPMEISFGDANNDGLINAQDALAAVNAWLRKTEMLYDENILALNVNADSRINTFDALGIVEAFVNQSEFAVISKSAVLSTKD